MDEGSSDTDPEIGNPDTRRAGTRSAARLATLVAVPLAVLAGVVSYAVHGDSGGGSGARPGDRGAASTGTTGQGGTAPGETAPGGTGRPSAGATGPVDVTAPALSGRAEVVCRALLSRLPGALRDRARRPVTAGAEQNAAYGDPPITVACGAPVASFPATDLVYVLDRVCWHAATTTGGTVWTTVDREVPVRVTVPGGYPEPGQWVIEFSGPLIEAVPSAGKAPAGCRN